MKKILLLLIAFSIKTSLQAQVKNAEEKQKSKLETFSDRSGSLTKKEITDIGKFNSVKLQVMKFTDVGQTTSLTGIRMEMPKTGTYAKGNFVVFLDSDEIDGFLKAINYLNDNVFNKPLPDLYTEYNFKSRAGLTAGGYKSEDGKWHAYLQLDKYNDDSEMFMMADELTQLRDLIIQAKAKM